MSITPSTYTRHVWANKGEEGAIPINATNLNEMEEGIEGANRTGEEIANYLNSDFETTTNTLFNDVYVGRDITEIEEIQDELDYYGSVPAFLQARAQNLDSSYLNIGDWVEINNTYMGTWKYAIYAFWPYLNAGLDGAEFPGHIAMGPLDTAFETTTTWASGSSGNNNGTSAQQNPYAGSQIHKFELETILPTFPTNWQNVMMETTLHLERRYSSSGTLTDSTDFDWINVGKIWSLSEVEVMGFPHICSVYASDFDCQFPFFKTTSHRVFHNQAGDRVQWWLRTVSGLNATAAGDVRADGDVFSNSTTNGYRVVPCFNVA